MQDVSVEEMNVIIVRQIFMLLIYFLLSLEILTLCDKDV